MRIAVVTAHYPPNLVSGGTLIPQHLADELAARGHSVDVFTGAYDESEPDMWSFTETADSGVRLQWTVTTGMLPWDCEDNYANPRMEAAFQRFLDRVRPEVVHFHSMQGLGGGLLTIARAAGAAVVLTMHDMWWWCSRQFLADRGMRPCSEVVECGVCPCDRDNGWLMRRNRGLAAHLDSADLVLAPSITMVELLTANGVDPARLELDENHAQSPLPQRVIRPDRRPSDPVRFVYAGGTHPLKGAGIAMDAARMLADTPGWELAVYGMDLPPGMPAQVHSLPPYDPAEVTDVLAGYDVLLLPSVATESYSLITREALNAGTVVLTGDNPGPLEVVRPGENGLVVPRGDARALADTMAQLVADRRLLDRLRPEPGQIRVRSLADQVDALEQRFTRLVTAQTAPDATAPGDSAPGGDTAPSATETEPIRRVLLLTGIGGAPLRYRARLPQEALAELGVRMDVRVYRDIDAPVLARTADAVVLYRVPATEQMLDLIEMVRSRPDPVPVLYDVDDLIFDPDVESDLADVLAPLSGQDRELYWRGVRRYRTSLEASDGYLGSTEMLCDEAARLTGMPTYRFANGIGVQLARASDAYLRRPRTPGPPRIGYLSGTGTHNEDWAFVEPAVLQVMRRRPDLQLTVGGLLDTTPALQEVADRVTRLRMLPWYELPGVLRDLDVNLAPLSPGRRFNEAKSAIKWLEAALVATPTIASATQPFREAIEHGVTGLLATSAEGFADGLLELLDDGDRAARMGSAARRRALLTLSPALQGHRYLAVLEQARKRVRCEGHREQFGPSGWQPVYDSEAYIPVAAEGYGPVPLPGVPMPVEPAPRSLRRIASDYRSTAWRHLRTEGPVSTARKTARVLRRLPARARARAG